MSTSGLARLFLKGLCYLLAVQVLSKAGAAQEMSDEPTGEWPVGPIRYILSAEQDRQYKQLKTPEERAEFIGKFWTALDPDPETTINERREEFWKRVNEANRLFPESVTPGWKTDRGKVYILMGPPDERIREEIRETWKYQAVGKQAAVPGIQIQFRKLLSGEFQMSRDALQYRDPFAKADGPPAGPTFLAVPSESGEPQIASERIRMVDFPRGGARAEFFAGPLLFTRGYEYYKAESGVTQVLLRLAVPTHQGKTKFSETQPTEMQMSLVAWDSKTGQIAKQSALKMPRVESELKRADETRLFQAQFELSPGTYQIDGTVFEPESHLGTRYSQTISVPDYGKGLALSSIVVGHLPTGPSGPLPPLRDGAIALLAEPVSLFVTGETLSFAYQVYNAHHQRKEPDLDAEYRILIEVSGKLQQVGRSIELKHLKSEALAYSLPLRGWPEGSYRVEVRITDNLANLTVSGEAPFMVGAAESDGQ